MSEFINELFLNLACNTPLPTGTTSDTMESVAPSMRRVTRYQIMSAEQANTPSEAQYQSTTSSPPQYKKRNRKPDVAIFIDIDADSSIPPPQQSSKKLKLNLRTPLSVKTDPGNAPTMPTPRAPDTPWPSSPSDPLWDNRENYMPYVTPPPTPCEASPAFVSWSYPGPSGVHTYTGSSSPPFPDAHAFPPPLSTRRRRATASVVPRPPKSMLLYNLLELDDWKAGSEAIKLGYKKAALKFHPDRVTEDERHNATIQMQRVNAAKEVLLDPKRRRAYNKNGKLPWVV